MRAGIIGHHSAGYAESAANGRQHAGKDPALSILDRLLCLVILLKYLLRAHPPGGRSAALVIVRPISHHRPVVVGGIHLRKPILSAGAVWKFWIPDGIPSLVSFEETRLLYATPSASYAFATVLSLVKDRFLKYSLIWAEERDRLPSPDYTYRGGQATCYDDRIVSTGNADLADLIHQVQGTVQNIALELRVLPHAGP